MSYATRFAASQHIEGDRPTLYFRNRKIASVNDEGRLQVFSSIGESGLYDFIVWIKETFDVSDSTIKVTPEMMEAGAAIIADFEFGWASPRDFARRVYLAMEVQRSPICRRNEARRL